MPYQKRYTYLSTRHNAMALLGENFYIAEVMTVDEISPYNS